MAHYARFTRRAGSNVHESTEDPAMCAIGDIVPDWVDLPAPLGGGRRTVESNRVVDCPCGGEHSAHELNMGDDGLRVAECLDKGFIWYRRTQ